MLANDFGFDGHASSLAVPADVRPCDEAKPGIAVIGLVARPGRRETNATTNGKGASLGQM